MGRPDAMSAAASSITRLWDWVGVKGRSLRKSSLGRGGTGAPAPSCPRRSFKKLSKTAVAAYAGWLCAGGGFQAALMAPTEVLAEQHYRSLSALLAPAGVRVGVRVLLHGGADDIGLPPLLHLLPDKAIHPLALVLGSMTAAGKKKIRSALEFGEIDFVVGTHALISEGVAFRRLI